MRRTHEIDGALRDFVFNSWLEGIEFPYSATRSQHFLEQAFRYLSRITDNHELCRETLSNVNTLQKKHLSKYLRAVNLCNKR